MMNYVNFTIWERIRVLPTVLPGFMEAIVAHCEVAQLFAARLGLNDNLQTALLQCNEQWDGHGAPGKIQKEQIRLAESAIYLSTGVFLMIHRLMPEALFEAMTRRLFGLDLDSAKGTVKQIRENQAPE
jgi:hypothetical protein